jgi:ABC-type nitrate/sulfonate/bicarbonate transport system ATPase subunit
MQELLLAIWEKYRFAVVFITHDVEEALFLADRILVFTRRPGCVKAEIGVDIQRPRSYEVLTSSEFVRLKRGVLGLVHSEAELAGDAEQ